MNIAAATWSGSGQRVSTLLSQQIQEDEEHWLCFDRTAVGKSCCDLILLEFNQLQSSTNYFCHVIEQQWTAYWKHKKLVDEILHQWRSTFVVQWTVFIYMYFVARLKDSVEVKITVKLCCCRGCACSRCGYAFAGKEVCCPVYLCADILSVVVNN